MARNQRASTASPERLILDSGAIIALTRGSRRARGILQRAVDVGAEVEIPAVVLAETLRGGPRDAPVHRLLATIARVVDTRAVHGRTAGRLLGAARSSETLDALVVAHAIEAGGGQVLTSDPTDLGRLAERHPEVQILRV